MAYEGPHPIPVHSGGTNATSMTNTDGIVYFDGTKLTTTTVGSATQVLTSNGTGIAPTFQAAASGTVTSVTGTANQVAVATGTTTPVISLIGPYTPSTYTAHGVVLGEGSSGLGVTAVGTTGQLLRGVTGADPTWSNQLSMGTAGYVFTQSASAQTSIVTISNLDGSAGSSSHLVITTLNTTNNPYINYFNGTNSWAHGINSSTGQFWIAPAPGITSGPVFTVTSSGNINKPLTSCFLATLTTPQSNVTGDGTSYTVPFNTTGGIGFDQNSNYSNPNYTAPVTGKYLIGFCISFSGVSVANTGFIEIVTTGNSFKVWQGSIGVLGSGPNICCSQLCEMNAGDTASIVVAISGGTKTVTVYGDSLGGTNFWGNLIA